MRLLDDDVLMRSRYVAFHHDDDGDDGGPDRDQGHDHRRPPAGASGSATSTIYILGAPSRGLEGRHYYYVRCKNRSQITDTEMGKFWGATSTFTPVSALSVGSGAAVDIKSCASTCAPRSRTPAASSTAASPTASLVSPRGRPARDSVLVVRGGLQYALFATAAFARTMNAVPLQRWAEVMRARGPI